MLHRLLLTLIASSTLSLQAENFLLMNADRSGIPAEFTIKTAASPLIIPAHSTLGPINLPPGDYEVTISFENQKNTATLTIAPEKANACILTRNDGKINLTTLPLPLETSATSTLHALALHTDHTLHINNSPVNVTTGSPQLVQEWDRTALGIRDAEGNFLFGVAADDTGSRSFIAIYTDDNAKTRSLTYVYASAPVDENAAAPAGTPIPTPPGKKEPTTTPEPAAVYDGTPIPATEKAKISTLKNQEIVITGTIHSVGESKSGKTRYINLGQRNNSIAIAIPTDVAGTTYSMDALRALIGKPISCLGKVVQLGANLVVRPDTSTNIKLEQPSETPPP